ncbi:MAG: hypothetical protein K0R29_1742 [Pseudobdellovibrio sp.]|jgi:uncharacterized membrane protein|nr:hypothetical protein [Pseudobdellovibrio sp.]
MHSTEWVHFIAKIVEFAGLAVMMAGGLYSVAKFILNLRAPDSYHTLRKNLGRSILLGLEFLVAGDIISTITVEPSLESVAILGLIVIIRTFLSFSLELEINGRWPWQAEFPLKDK